MTRTECSYRRMFERLLAEEKVAPVKIMEVNSVDAIKKWIMANIGISILPHIAVTQEIAMGQLKALHLADWVLETALLMVWHKEKWLSPALEAFMNMVCEMLGNQDVQSVK